MRKRRVAIYVRVSTIEQAREGYSVQEQIKRLTRYCEAMGWIVVKVYVDAGASGSDVNRVGLQDLIEEIDTFDTVLVYKLDRLSRSQKDTLFLIEDVFLANGVDFVSTTESFDTSTPFGRAMVGILAVFAQLERENIKERMAIGKQARAELGKFHGSKWVPIGYDYVDDELVVNEYEKMQIHKIFSLFQSGKSINSITNQLNNEGLQHKHGKWNHKTVKRILGAKTYLGYLKYKGVWYKGKHDPIISPEEYERAQALLEARTDNIIHANTYTAALGGLCVCGHCGARYTRRRSSKPNKSGEYRYYYSCYSRNKISPAMIKDPNCKNKTYRKEVLENMIFDEVKKLAIDPEAISNIQKESEGKDYTEDIKLVEKQIDELNRRLSNLVDLFSIGNMDMSIVEAKTNTIQEERRKLEQKLHQMKETDKPSVIETQELAKSLVDAIERGDDDEIRTILQMLINEIIIDEEDVVIHWKFA